MNKIDPVRVLKILDGLALLYFDSYVEHTKSEDKTPFERFIDAVYRISHAGSQLCGNSHEDWIEEILETEKHLIQSNYLSSWSK